ncbi:GNAT family N-acetyltransferase [Aminobacter sp. AP02]|uniref:GNAT family N-acetyltransferase n=1 Tax=Aminobacter sp. AP02 TaxID=2135737 RepID=UPI000D6AA605|nr:GNAT family N-acetyltransferase [Aminobacter sp. AP02]PWK73862.1 acetyltransferase (GNAT) family protein [Aminobacter sp. AP02]
MSLQEPGAARDALAPFTMRPAAAGDFGFCRALYLSSMHPLQKALGIWDEKKVKNAFKEYFKSEEIRIVLVDGVKAGWIQVSHTASEVHLDQIHLNEEIRGRGIGTKLIRETMAEARSMGKPLLLSLLRGNRAISLYRRLGFELNGSDHTKLHMRWSDQ